ncbi:hypothetical protein MAR_022856 [Mya arenaria]|uniref:Mitochondria-eating protein C-terminal domain-containing protein n=1 Tax=Mya arenaria TaxID=6604 RepID=A0ABY7DNM9_MYAAR|nr:hypothetical protein MAR_022856 [Mya arenaria]
MRTGFVQKNAADMLKKTEHVAVKLFEECNKSQISVCQSVAIPMSKPNDGTRQFSLSMLEEQFIERHWKPKIVPVRDHTGGRRAPNREKEIIKPAKMEGELVKLRKEVSLSMIPVVQQAYLRGKWDETCIEPLKPFIQKCLFLCWMMVVQSPPMVFYKNTEEGTRFESALYKQYTQTGDVLEYVVWPALLLHEDGPLVFKGVAQPKKAKE